MMGAAALIAGLLTRSLVQPILKMTDDLEHIQENVPYRELIPFAESIHSDRLLRENNEKMRQDFTANVSHELKTPLTIIEGNAELLAEDDGLTAEQKAQIESILQGAEQTRTYLGKIRAEVQTPLRYKRNAEQ